MATLVEPYKDINRTLQMMRIQIIESLDYCVNELPSFKDPKDLFQFCRRVTTYHLDPKNEELLQSVPTLFEDNWWGQSGAGDCDCFTILTLALCVANGWNDNYIVLVGRTKRAPVHIYSAVKYNGKIYTLDLTNPYINIERPYKYCQWIPC